MKHVIFTQYAKSKEHFDVLNALVDNGFDYQQLLVSAQKQLLKKFGYQQKGWCADVVDDKALTFLTLKFADIKSVSWEEAAQ